MHFDYSSAQLKSRDMLREAEQRRLIRQARARQSMPSLFAASAAALGQQLIRFGSRLTNAPAAPTPCEVCPCPA